MVHLDRLTTRSGDNGSTGLSDGSRVAKCHPLITVIGTVDEAGSLLGVVACEDLPAAVAAELPRIQNDCFDLGADLATPPGGQYEDKIPRVSSAQVERLEAAVTAATAQLQPLKSFILPGGTKAAAWLHLARTVVRRAERELVAAQQEMPERIFNPCCVQYLNRLSDLCFAWARLANDGGKADVLWVPGGNRGR